MIEIFESTTPEVLTEAVTTTVVDAQPVIAVVETTVAGPDLLTETFKTDVVVDQQADAVVATEVDTYVLETAEQGPPGPAGGVTPSYPGKTLVWASGVLSEVLLYLDAAKTSLAERRVLNRSGGVLTSIQYFSGAGALTATRNLSYTSGQLTGVTQS